MASYRGTLQDASGNTLLPNVVEYGTWTPHIYDLNTYKNSFTSNSTRYARIGNIVIYWFNSNGFPTTTISTMLQIRNMPTFGYSTVGILGGTLYYAGDSNQFGNKTIQIAENSIYVRPNWTGTLTNGQWFSGMAIGMLT